MATDLNSPHDRFFKAIFSHTAVAAEFLQGYLPAAVAATLDWSTLRAEKDTFLDPQLMQHPADLLYAVNLCGGEPGYIHLLFEHKSYVESRINLDLLRYRVRIWEQWLNAGNTGLLPVIIPVVFYHGAGRWGVKRQFAETVMELPELQRYVPTCEYHLVDVSAYRDEELRGAVRLQVALLTLKYIFRDELGERLPGILGLLRELEDGSSGLDLIRSLLRYLVQVVGTDRLSAAAFRQAVTQALSGGDAQMTTIAEQWVQEGLEKGLQQGLQQGEALLLRRLLIRRFGPLPEWAETRLAEATPAHLERWGERVLVAATLEAVFIDA